jgi:hypothetical protein
MQPGPFSAAFFEREDLHRAQSRLSGVPLTMTDAPWLGTLHFAKSEKSKRLQEDAFAWKPAKGASPFPS